MECTLHNKVNKKHIKLYPKVKRTLINRHRRLQNNELLHELQNLLLAEKSCRDLSTPVSKTFQRGYLNAVTEVSRLLASIPNVDVEMGKIIMTHLGLMYNRLMQQSTADSNEMHIENHNDSAPVSPASSGYCSDDDDGSEMATNVWRPW